MFSFNLFYLSFYLICALLHTEASSATQEHINDKLIRHATPPKVLNKGDVGVIHKTSPDTVTERKSTGENPISPKTMQQEIIELSHTYVSNGMSYTDAMREAIKNVRVSKYTPLEKKLAKLGCVKWDEISEITPDILDTVNKFHNPEKGEFILQPGLSIVYIKDIR